MKRHLFKAQVLLSLLVCISLLIGCTTTPPVPTKIHNFVTETATFGNTQISRPKPLISITPSPTQTPNIPNLYKQYTPQSILVPTSNQPTHDTTPIQFTFPTPLAPPISMWRPPLYDVPWCPSPYDHFYFKRPIAADVVNWPLADYRYGGTFSGTTIVHTGIDIDAPQGTPVLAAAPGIVSFAGNGLFFGKYNPDDPYGIAVVIKHNFGYQGSYLYTVYAHMDRIDVVESQHVETGTQIGIVGLTGNTTGPHLHFEVRIGKNSFFVTRNPELWLAPPQGWGVLVGRLQNLSGGPIEKVDVLVRSESTSQVWKIRTYGAQTVNSDSYYRENLVLSDLPAGEYQIEFSLNDLIFYYDVTIYPGATTYFMFNEKFGFKIPSPTPASPDLWLNP